MNLEIRMLIVCNWHLKIWMIQKHLFNGIRNKHFYVKLPVSVIDKWNEYVKIQLYGRQHAFEIALIKYINKYDHEKVFDRAKHFNDMSKADVEYKTFTISASEKIIDLWKEYCGKVNVFTTAQFTADALMEAMNITV